MGRTALMIAKAISYRNAGTVEFILDENENFYFLEVNTRLQVEHPITEAITGLDLVELQIRVAEGFSLHELGLVEGSIARRGHAIECRLYAEDTENDFLPSPGRLIFFEPAQIEGVRYDSGVASGSEISMFYDPMIAKVIAWSPTRLQTLSLIHSAITRTRIVGITTNQLFLCKVLSNPHFIKGTYNTGFITKHLSNPTRHHSIHELEEEQRHVAISAMLFLWNLNKLSRTLHRHITPGFRNVFYRHEYKTIELEEKRIQVFYKCLPQSFSQSKNKFRETWNFEIFVETKKYDVSFEAGESHVNTHVNLHDKYGTITCTINGKRIVFFIFFQNSSTLHIQSESLSKIFLGKEIPKIELSFQLQEMTGLVKATMTGKIVAISISPDHDVKEGDVLLIMESMKMETKIRSPRTGTIHQVFVLEGQVVEEGQPLLSFTS
eukprot:TRINITY_DN9780_c0_g3_i2.p1 TRINITY_DN9780_c0_g3~~TRINITY_DN9780_c0_g3_i2.p1  ORF type:complete len:436 (-),score=83.95 TRINITY_DN9780_c0_g3_i2:84-1391(-)